MTEVKGLSHTNIKVTDVLTMLENGMERTCLRREEREDTEDAKKKKKEGPNGNSRDEKFNN